MGKYTFRSRIRYSECDENCRVHLPGVVNYFQDAATFQGEELGVGIPWMRERSLAWVLVYWQIITDHMPRLGEEVTVRTWPYSFNRFYGLRNLVMEDGQGKRAAWANSVWVLINTQMNRMTRVPEEMTERYGQEEMLDMDYAPRKIIVPDGGETMESFLIHRGHLDSNHHVNNGQYIHMALDYLPESFDLYETRVEYRKQSFLGDVIRPLVVSQEENVTVSLLKEDGQACAVVQFLSRPQAG